MLIGVFTFIPQKHLLFCLSIGSTLSLVLVIYPLLLANTEPSSKLHLHRTLRHQLQHNVPTPNALVNTGPTVGTDVQGVNDSVPMAHRKFLFAITHQEQLTSSSMNFIQLLQLAQRWQKRVPEPFICHNRMVGFPHICTAANGVVRYSLIFNLSDLAYKLKSPLCNISGNVEGLIAPADVFLQELAGNTTLLYFLYDKQKFPLRSRMETLDNLSNPGLSVCSKEAKEFGMIRAVEGILNRNRTGHARITNVVCVDPRNVSFDEIMKLLTDLSLHKDNIVLLQWRKLKKLANHVKEARELRVMCKKSPKASPSPIVFNYSQQFLNSLKLRKPFLSLHMRTERIIIGEYGNKGYIGCCMDTLTEFLPKVMSKYNLKDVLLIRDYSSHGTDSCSHGDKQVSGGKNYYTRIGSCRRVSDAMMLRLEALGLKVVEFIPTEHGAPEMSGLAARVEAVTLAQGAAFVGVGGGSFQHFIEELFQDLHKTKEGMYEICIPYQQCKGEVEAVTLSTKKSSRMRC